MEIAQKLPFSFEAEQSVLGAIIIDSAVLDSIVPILKNSDNFYAQSHKRIYDVMLAMHVANKPIDFVTLLEEVKAAGIFSEEEGKQYLLQLTQVVPSTENAVNYAKIVADKAVLRQLIAAADTIRTRSEEAAEESSMILEHAEQTIYDIANGRVNTGLYSISEGYIDAIDRYGRLAEEDSSALLGVPTGFADIDSMLNGGMRKSELIILAARPAVGKSAFALNICENAAVRHGIKTVFFSLEMSSAQLVDRDRLAGAGG
jgi:replicative DNA helicase